MFLEWKTFKCFILGLAIILDKHFTESLLTRSRSMILCFSSDIVFSLKVREWLLLKFKHFETLNFTFVTKILEA